MREVKRGLVEIWPQAGVVRYASLVHFGTETNNLENAICTNGVWWVL